MSDRVLRGTPSRIAARLRDEAALFAEGLLGLLVGPPAEREALIAAYGPGARLVEVLPAAEVNVLRERLVREGQVTLIPLDAPDGVPEFARDAPDVHDWLDFLAILEPERPEAKVLRAQRLHYLAEVRRRNARLDLTGFPGLAGVSLAIEELSLGGPELPESGHVLVLGPAGSGKTTLVRREAFRLAGPESASLPVLLSASAFVEVRRTRLRSLREFVCEELVALGVTHPRALLDEAGDELVVLVDGLDEVPPRSAGVVANALNELAQTRCRAIATGRTARPPGLEAFRPAFARIRMPSLARERVGGWVTALFEARRCAQPEAATELRASACLEAVEVLTESVPLASPLALITWVSVYMVDGHFPASELALDRRLTQMLERRWRASTGEPRGTAPGGRALRVGEALARLFRRTHPEGRASRQALLEHLRDLQTAQGLSAPEALRGADDFLRGLSGAPLLLHPGRGHWRFVHSAFVERFASLAARDLLDSRRPLFPRALADALPSSLLEAWHEVVPFRTRPELGALRDWCETPHPFRLCLVSGPLGSGKTRLGIELCSRLRKAGWHAGFLPKRVDDVDPDWVRSLLEDPTQRLIVVDYAETQRSRIRELLRRLAGRRLGSRIRLLLLARATGDWWTELRESDEVVGALLADASLSFVVSPIATDLSLRNELLRTAAQAFSAARGLGAPALAKQDLTAEHFGRPLYLHMAALAALRGEALGSSEELLARTLTHERSYWSHAWQELEAAQLLRRTVPLALGALTLAGGARSREEAADLVARALPSPATPGDVLETLDFLNALYPSESGQRFVDGLRPDLLGEQLLWEINRDDDALLRRVFRDPNPQCLRHGLLVLDRMASRRPGAVSAWLRIPLEEDLAERAEVALEVAQASGSERADGSLGRVLAELLQAHPDPRLARRLLQAIPRHTVSLRELATEVTRQRLAALDGSPADEERRVERAMLLNNLGVSLGNLGLREEALEATEEAVQHYRKLAEVRPGAFLSDLAMALNNFGVSLSKLGRLEKALEATEEAVRLHRELAAAQGDASLPDLSAALNNLGIRLSKLGRREEALQATAEAVQVCRKLATARPDAFLPDLAAALNNLSVFLSNLGRREEAFQATREAGQHYRQLAAARPDAFLPDLAAALNNLSVFLSNLGRREEALQATQEAVGIRRRLAETRPGAFLSDLASALNNLGRSFSKLGRHEEALQATQEAVQHYRQLAVARPDAFLPDLAAALNNLSVFLSNLGLREEALQATLEAVNIRRQLAEARPDVFLPDLASGLNNLGIRLSSLERREEALQTTREAALVLMPFFRANPGAFSDNMLVILSNYASSVETLGQEPMPELEALLCELATPEPKDGWEPDEEAGSGRGGA